MKTSRIEDPQRGTHCVSITTSIYDRAKAHASAYSLPFGRVVDIALLMFLEKYDK